MPLFNTSRKTLLGTVGACLGLFVHNTFETSRYLSNKPLELFVAISSFQIKVFHIILLSVFLIANFMKWAIFGRLTDNEIKILRQKIGNTVWEFVFGFLVFYDTTPSFKDIGWEVAKYAGLFTCVVLVKCFHYLAADRVHTIHRLPSDCGSPLSSAPHIRLRLGLGLAIIMYVQLLLIIRYIYDVSLQSHINGNVLVTIFGYEILSHVPLTFTTSVEFCLNLYESRTKKYSDQAWLYRRLRIVFFTEFLFVLLRFVMSCIFTLVFMYYYTFPVHTMPSSYTSLKLAVTKTRRLVNLRKSELLILKVSKPDVAFLQTCIICYDDLTNETSSASCIRSCGHTFHRDCLRLWFNTAPTCPICRSKV